MKTLRLLPLVLLLLVTACADEYEDDAMVADPAAVTADRDAFVADVDSRLAAFDNEYSTLQSQIAGLDEEIREEVADEIEEIAEEREDIVALREEAAMATTYDELTEAREKIREEYSDIDELLTEARFEIIDEYPEFRTAMQAEMTELDGELDQMEMRAAELQGDARARYDEMIADLEQRRTDLSTRLEQTTEENWREARGEMIGAWNEIKGVYYGLPDVDVEVHRNGMDGAQN